MTVRIWPHEFKHLNEWIDRVIAGSPADLELPLPGPELIYDDQRASPSGLFGQTTSGGSLRVP